MNGKHTEKYQEISRLKKTIELKNKEIEEIKISCADVFKEICKMAEQNSLGNENVKFRRIAEIARETQWQLMRDVEIENDTDINKIIELQMTANQ